MNALLYKDFTIKAKVENWQEIELLVESLGAQRVGQDLQIDTYFKVDSGRLKLRQGSIENLITHYERIQENGIERTIVYRYDLNPTEEEKKILFKDQAVIGIVKKERLIFLLQPCKIHLDRLGNQDFLEIEAIDREDKYSTEELKTFCFSLKDKLNIKDEDLLPTGYFKL